MHATLAFLNGAGVPARTAKRGNPRDLQLLNVLLAAAGPEENRPSVDSGKSKDERQAEEEGKAAPVSKPGGFDNDPPDPRNPNEVRERYRTKISP